MKYNLTKTLYVVLALSMLLYCSKDSLWDTTVPETEDEPTSSEIKGYIFRPALVSATNERVAQLKLPTGFSIHKFAETGGHPRILAISPAGNVYYSDKEAGTVTRLSNTDNDDSAEVKQVVATLKGAHGLSIHQGKMYIATVKEVYVSSINADGSLTTPALLISDLPDGGQHPNRTLAVGPDNMLYVSVGSTCNSCSETNPANATLLRYDLAGKNPIIYASGLRNTIGFAWHPASGNLWGMDHGIDWLGDNEQKEELNAIVQNKFYGWPYIYGEGKYNGMTRPPADSTYQQFLSKTQLPTLLYDAHSAPMQMAFYPGNNFGAEYTNDAFVAFRGSWNRSKPAGYKIVRVHFENGTPVRFEDFLSGFLVDNNRSQFARVVGVAVHPDGSLFISEDANGVIYRISKN